MLLLRDLRGVLLEMPDRAPVGRGTTRGRTTLSAYSTLDAKSLMLLLPS